MGVDDRFAPVQFFINRREDRVPKPFIPVIGIQADSVGLKGIERIFRLAEGSLGVRDRDRGKIAKAARMFRTQLGGSFVAAANDLPHFFHIPNREPRSRDGQDRRRGAVLVHVFEVLGQGPLGVFAAAAAPPAFATSAGGMRSLVGSIDIRNEVMMDIDAARICALGGGLVRECEHACSMAAIPPRKPRRLTQQPPEGE